MTAIATDAVTDGPLIDLPAEAGDIDAVVFEPNEDWLRQASPDAQKTAMWRWFATRFEHPDAPESAGPQDSAGDRVSGAEEADFHADRVLHDRFDHCVPEDVVAQLVARVQAQGGTSWARRGIDKMSS